MQFVNVNSIIAIVYYVCVCEGTWQDICDMASAWLDMLIIKI